MTEVLLLSLFQRGLGTHQAADYIPPVSLLIAWSLIDDGQLRTLSKCSAYVQILGRKRLKNVLVRTVMVSVLSC